MDAPILALLRLELVGALEDLVVRHDEVDEEESRETVIERQRRLLLGAEDAPRDAQRELLKEDLVALLSFGRSEEVDKVGDDDAKDLQASLV